MLVHTGTIFFIGFNKCGTHSLHRYLTEHGVKSLHGGTSQEPLLHHQIIMNIAMGRAPLDGLPVHEAWLDVASVQREFREFDRAYPAARFVLNTRDVDRWLVSRLNHLDGRYVAFMNLMYRRKWTWRQWANAWRNEFLEHERAVPAHFAGRANFLRFDIERDPLDKLATFLRLGSTAGTLPREGVTDQSFFVVSPRLFFGNRIVELNTGMRI